MIDISMLLRPDIARADGPCREVRRGLALAAIHAVEVDTGRRGARCSSLEGPTLQQVASGRHRLTCLPLARPVLEAASADAVLEPCDQDIPDGGTAAGETD